MDTRPREMLGEHYIKSRLLKYDFEIHSELSYDKDGADFMVTEKIDRTKLNYIIIQSKSREIKKSTSVKIPKQYVNKNFVLFVYLINQKKEENLFCFFHEDYHIFRDRGSEYILYINEKKINFLHEGHTFDQSKAERINLIFKELQRKKYTSIIIDGFFLEESIIKTTEIYTEIYKREFQKPSLVHLAEKINSYFNRFSSNFNDIAFYLYISKDRTLENHILLDDKVKNLSIKESSAKIFTTYTDKLIPFHIMNDLERFKQSDNIILIANDIIYEHFLSNLEIDPKSIIVARLKTEDRPQEMFVKYRWQDIIYPIGLALGLKSFEL